MDGWMDGLMDGETGNYIGRHTLTDLGFSSLGTSN